MSDPTDRLTGAEELVLRVVVEAGSGKVAAGWLGISHQTVRNQLHSAYGKLGVTSLVGAYRRLGWLVAPKLD